MKRKTPENVIDEKGIERINTRNCSKFYMRFLFKREKYPDYFIDEENDTKYIINNFISEVLSILMLLTNCKPDDIGKKHEDSDDEFKLLIIKKTDYYPNKKIRKIITIIKRNITKSFVKYSSIIDTSIYTGTFINSHTSPNYIISKVEGDEKGKLISEKDIPNFNRLRGEVYDEIDKTLFEKNIVQNSRAILEDTYEFIDYYRGEYIFKRRKDQFCFNCEDYCGENFFLYYDDKLKLSNYCEKTKNRKIKLNPAKKVNEKITDIIEMDNYKKWGIAYDEYTHYEMKPYEIHKYDTILVKANMGVGKTQELISSLKGGPLKNLSKDKNKYMNNGNHVVICITARITQLEEGFSKYKKSFDVGTYKEMIDFNKNYFYLTQLESVHKIEKYIKNMNIILILDESESLLSQYNSNLGVDQAKYKRMFDHLVNYSKKLIMMDAFLGFRTFELLKRSERQLDKSFMYSNLYQYKKFGHIYDNQAYFIDYFKETVEKICKNKNLDKETIELVTDGIYDIIEDIDSINEIDEDSPSETIKNKEIDLNNPDTKDRNNQNNNTILSKDKLNIHKNDNELIQSQEDEEGKNTLIINKKKNVVIFMLKILSTNRIWSSIKTLKKKDH